MATKSTTLATKLLAILVHGLALKQTEAQSEVLVRRIGQLSPAALQGWHDELHDLQRIHGVSETHATEFTNKCGTCFRLVSS